VLQQQLQAYRGVLCHQEGAALQLLLQLPQQARCKRAAAAALPQLQQPNQQQRQLQRLNQQQQAAGWALRGRAVLQEASLECPVQALGQTLMLWVMSRGVQAQSSRHSSGWEQQYLIPTTSVASSVEGACQHHSQHMSINP
jgi:hypothetical protein